MTKAELLDALRDDFIPDDARIAVNIGYDADNLTVSCGAHDKYTSYYLEGWLDHERPAVCSTDNIQKQQRLFS